MNKFITIVFLLCYCACCSTLNAQNFSDTIPYADRFLYKSMNGIIETIAEQNHTLVINELMASNYQTSVDENGDSDDWFEIYNYGEDSINLSLYYFSDARNTPFKWKISNTEDVYLRANEFIIFWADNETEQGVLHTNFKLSENGEELFIHYEDGTLIDQIEYKKQATDISFGRYPDGSLQLYHFGLPTPNMANSDNLIEGILGKPTSDLKSGFYDSPIQLKLSYNDYNCKIYYTLNNAEPTEGSILYTDPITIDKTTVVRAKTFKPGYASSLSLTQTFIFNNNIPENPIINIVSDSIYLYGSGGILSRATDIEAPAHMEYMKNGVTEYSSGMGIKLHSPKSQKQYSMRFYARNRYGNSWFKYPFFEKLEIDKYKRIIVRNAGNDNVQTTTGNVHFRDQLIQRMAQKTNNAIISECKPINLYVNGHFFGVYNLRERIDEYYMETHFPDIQNYSLLERCFGYPANKNNIYGNWQVWDSVMYYIDTLADLSNDTVFNEISNIVDIENFTDYWLTEIFVGNYDWLSNNIKFFVPETGKWRWIFWDIDHGLGYHYRSFGNPDWNTLEWSLTFSDRAWPNGYNNRLIRNLLKNEQYKQYFIKRYSYLMNTIYNEKNLHPMVDSIAQLYKEDLNKHAEKWSFSTLKWNNYLIEVKDYITNRADYVFGHISEFFGMSESKNLNIITSPQTENVGKFIFDHNRELLNEFHGQVFSEYEYNIKVIPQYPWKFIGWKDINSVSTELNLKCTNDTTLIAQFAFDPGTQIIFLNEVYFNSEDKFTCGDWLELVNLASERVDLLGYKIFENDNLLAEFTDHTYIEPQEYIILAKNKQQFEDVYLGLSCASCELKNNISENAELIIKNKNNDTVQTLNYTMGNNNWPTLVTNSFSYELMEYSENVDKYTYWNVSKDRYGSPGIQNGLSYNLNVPQGESNQLKLGNTPHHKLNDTIFGFHDIDGHNCSGIRIIDINGSVELQWKNLKCIPDSIYEPGNFSCLAPNQNNTVTVISFTLIDNSGDESSVNYLTIEGPDDILSYKPEITIFPNPVKNNLNINIDGFNHSTMDITIYSLDGNVTITKTNANADSNLSLDISSLKNGYYIISISYNNQISVKKLIKV